jgi:trimethylamine--corrinoid protein Co-methyltransferase
LLYGRCQLPVLVPLAPICGATTPYTLAGTVVNTNAAALGSLVLLQTLCPGIPSSYYYFMQTLEMHTGRTEFLNPETLLIASSLARMGAYYRLPVVTSSIENSGCESNQVMFERGVSLIMSILGGVGAVGGAGGLEGGNFVSPLALVIDDELMAFVRRIWEGFSIDSPTLGVAAIQRVGHSGNYLSDQHTLEHLYRERRFKPTLFDWRPYAEWQKNSASFIERAEERLNDIRRNHEVPPFEPALEKELGRIIRAADDELAA